MSEPVSFSVSGTWLLPLVISTAVGRSFDFAGGWFVGCCQVMSKAGSFSGFVLSKAMIAPRPARAAGHGAARGSSQQCDDECLKGKTIMRTHDLENDSELQRVLWACYSYWQTEPLPPEDRVICHKWVLGRFRSRFSVGFHQSRLNALSELGLLTKHDTSRGGNRRYYTIQEPKGLEALLRKWSLH